MEVKFENGIPEHFPVASFAADMLTTSILEGWNDGDNDDDDDNNDMDVTMLFNYICICFTLIF